MAASEQLISVTMKLLFFFVPQLLLWIFVIKSGNRWSFRFSRVEGHRHLRPFAKTWIIAIVIFLTTVFSSDIFEFMTKQTVHNWLAGFGYKLIFFTISLALFGFLWIYNYFLEKKWDNISWIAVVIIVLCGFLYVYI